MFRRMCRAKIHNATVTACRANYPGSIAVGKALLDAAKIREMEFVHVFNVSNAKRFETYAIAGKAGTVEVLGAAAKLCRPGDRIILVAEAIVEEKELSKLESNVVIAGPENRILEKRVKKQTR